MTVHEYSGDPQALPPFVLPGFAIVAAGLVIGLGFFFSPPAADALPSYAQQTHLACGRCHVNPAGGGERTAFGKAFAANGHKLAAAAGTEKSDKKGEANKKTAESSPSSPAAPSSSSSSAENVTTYVPWSLREPYHTHFLYDSCDYQNCATQEKK